MPSRDGFAEEPDIKKGVYRHYKGREYEVLDVACHSETHEWYVVYKRLYEAPDSVPETWVRPAHMFFEVVTWDGTSMPRFTHVRGVQ